MRYMICLLALLLFAADADAHRGRKRRKARRAGRRHRVALVMPTPAFTYPMKEPSWTCEST